MIAAHTGTPGSGKSFGCVKLICDAIAEGKCVATNVTMVDDWARVVAMRSPLNWINPRRRASCEAQYTDRMIVVRTLDELMAVQLAPLPLKGRGAARARKWAGTALALLVVAVVYPLAGGLPLGRPGQIAATLLAALFVRTIVGGGKAQVIEGRGVAVIDEAHEWLNNRMWDEDKKLRARYVQWFSVHRHAGWNVHVITQHLDSLDKQVRDRIEFHVVLRNFKNARIMGLPLCPGNLFLSTWVWTQTGGGRKRHVNRRSLYRLDSRKRLYNTHGLAAGNLDPKRPVLPRSAAPVQVDA